MLINGLEVNRDNIQDWSCGSLRNIQGTLAHNVGQGWGDVEEEKLMMKLISIEIKRQVKIDSINTAAEKKKQWTIKHWQTIERQIEPLACIKFGENYD